MYQDTGMVASFCMSRRPQIMDRAQHQPPAPTSGFIRAEKTHSIASLGRQRLFVTPSLGAKHAQIFAGSNTRMCGNIVSGRIPSVQFSGRINQAAKPPRSLREQLARARIFRPTRYSLRSTIAKTQLRPIVSLSPTSLKCRKGSTKKRLRYA